MANSNQNKRFANYRLNGYKRILQQSAYRQPVPKDGIKTGVDIGCTIGILIFHLVLIYIATMLTLSTHYYNMASDAYRSKDIEAAIKYQRKGQMFSRLVPFLKP